MKILFSWLLDHLDCNFNDIKIENLVHLFNIRTAEIESFQTVTFDKNQFFIVQITEINEHVTASCPELKQTLQLPKRTDAAVGKNYLTIKNGASFRWATLADFGAEKDGLMTALHLSDQEIAGAWKKNIPATDYVLDIDNKSINHRPDLWGHHGIAREVSAFLNIKLKSLPLASNNVDHDKHTIKTKNFTLSLQTPEACSRVAALPIENVANHASNPFIAIRLARVDGKPINAIVDLTNYVMFDVGHPMHAFDTATFADGEMIVRMAKNNETVELLDGSNVELLSTDVVIANKKNVVSLPGIMGGKHSGVQASSTSIILEAAGLDPLVIRKTAQRLKVRSESCMRFEKHLDPMQNIIAIARFVFLATQQHLMAQSSAPILSVGSIVTPATISLSHNFVEKQLGTTLEPKFIENALTKLGFTVDFDAKKELYSVTIPTNRMSKDIKIQQDLVEEIIRSYGFENIKNELPIRQTTPFSTNAIANVDHVKWYLAFGMHMHELRDYLMFDAAFVARFNLDMTHAIQIKNPMSQNWTTLVTSLIPHLLKAIDQNAASHDHLRFFELNSTWHKDKNNFVEEKKLSGIIFDKKNVDFYAAKSELTELFNAFKMKVVWKKATSIAPWFHAHQTAELFVDNQSIGFAGMISPAWMHAVTNGSAFIFELQSSLFEHAQTSNTKFKAWSKFQEVTYDISLFVPLACSIDTIKHAMLQADKQVQSVSVIDFFEKPEWPNQRAVTLRYTMNNAEKTMTKEDLDMIVQKITKAVQSHDAQIR